MKKLTTLFAIGLAALLLSSPAPAQETRAGGVPKFVDEPAARLLYRQMEEAIEKATTISYISRYQREAVGQAKTACTYRLWLKKPNYFRMESESVSGRLGGVLIGDGQTLWIHWPEGRPRWPYLRETEEDERTQFTSYMTKPAAAGKHSIWHEALLLGGGMSFPILEASQFHGSDDPIWKHLDAMRIIGGETVADEACDKIEISLLGYQRSWFLWLSKKDHLPRRMKEIVRIAYDNITHEEWSSVAVNEEIPDSLFAWQPPAGWTEWTLPDPDAGLLKPGSKAPDFEMASVDGKRIRLSDYQGSAVWLCFWRLGCPPCREETPFLQELHTKYGDQGIVVLGVNVSDQRQLTLDYLRELGVTFPNILDTSEAAQEVCHQVYGGGGVPLNYLIDRNGNVVDAGFYHLSARAKTALGQVGIDLE